jgi:hypothetical protein
MSGPRLSIIPAAAVEDTRLTLSALRTLCYLGKHTNDEGWCRAKQKTMAAGLKLARSTVQASLDLLYELGYVEREHAGWKGVDPDDSKQPFAAHYYRVKLDRGGPPADTLSDQADETAAECPQVMHRVPDGPGTRCPAGRAPGARLDRAPHSERPTSNEHGGGDARARPAGLISEEAFKLADEITEVVGHDPRHPPPSWCGAAMRVQTWLAQGWPRAVILIAIRKAMGRKRDGPPGSVVYFEKAIAREIAQQAAPLPTATVVPFKPEIIHDTGQRRSRLHEARDRILSQLNTPGPEPVERQRPRQLCGDQGDDDAWLLAQGRRLGP